MCLGFYFFITTNLIDAKAVSSQLNSIVRSHKVLYSTFREKNILPAQALGELLQHAS